MEAIKFTTCWEQRVNYFSKLFETLPKDYSCWVVNPTLAQLHASLGIFDLVHRAGKYLVHHLCLKYCWCLPRINCVLSKKFRINIVISIISFIYLHIFLKRDVWTCVSENKNTVGFCGIPVFNNKSLMSSLQSRVEYVLLSSIWKMLYSAMYAESLVKLCLPVVKLKS